MWIHSHSPKHENSKDSYAKISTFRTVQFTCMTNMAWW